MKPFAEWLTRSRLATRLGLTAGSVFLWGLLGRFDSLWLGATLFALLAGVGFVWAAFAAFPKSGGFLKESDSNRWVLGGAWLLSPLLLVPAGYLGNEAALAFAPYSAEELAVFAAAEAEALAELEAQEELERQRIAEEEAAEAEAEKLEAERARLQQRTEEIATSLVGLSEGEATAILEEEGILSAVSGKCDSSPEGTVVATSLITAEKVKIEVARGISELPDVVGESEAFARASIEKACYQMKNVKSYFAYEQDGHVVAQEPAPGQLLEVGAEIEIMSSEWPVMAIKTADSVGRWEYLGPEEEDWNFRGPRAKDGKLFIPMKVAFSTDMSWRDDNATGEGFGTAIIVDEFNKEVPVRVLYGKQFVPAGEAQNFTAVVPLTDLDDKTPTKVYLYLWVEVGGSNKSVTANFTMTW